LYLELYEEDFTKRVMPQRTGQQVNKNEAMTPENIAWAKKKAQETAQRKI